MSVMSQVDALANSALDAYLEYMEYDGDEIGNEERRFQFIDEAVVLLELLTGRNVSEEID